jgi:hypothetical protein
MAGTHVCLDLVKEVRGDRRASEGSSPMIPQGIIGGTLFYFPYIYNMFITLILLIYIAMNFLVNDVISPSES